MKAWAWRNPDLYLDTARKADVEGSSAGQQQPLAEPPAPGDLPCPAAAIHGTMPSPLNPLDAPKPSQEQQLYSAYLELLAKDMSGHTPEERQEHFGLFRQQLLAELRAGEQAAERFIKRQGARAKFRQGQIVAQKHLRPLVVEWMVSLQSLLEHELVKVRWCHASKPARHLCL